MSGNYDSTDVQNAYLQLHNTVFLLENDVSGAMAMAAPQIRKAYLVACFRKCEEIRNDVQQFRSAVRRELEMLE